MQKKNKRKIKIVITTGEAGGNVFGQVYKGSINIYNVLFAKKI